MRVPLPQRGTSVRQGPCLFWPPENLQWLTWCFIQRTLPPSSTKETLCPLLGGGGERWPCGIRFPLYGSITAGTRGKIQEVTTSQTTMTPWGVRGRARGPGDLVAVQLPPGKWGPHAPHLRGVPFSFSSTFHPLWSEYSPTIWVSENIHCLSLSLFPKSTFKHIYLRKRYSKNPRGSKWDQARQPSVPKSHQISLLPTPPHPAVSTFEKVRLSLPTSSLNTQPCASISLPEKGVGQITSIFF